MYKIIFFILHNYLLKGCRIINNVTGKLLSGLCAVALTAGFAAVCYAAGEKGTSSYKTITSDRQGAAGPVVAMQGNIKVTGENYSSSTNTLYVCINQSQNDSNTSWKELQSWPIKPGYSLTSGSRSGNALGNYRVLLDPSGAWATGCNGWGKISN